MKKNKLKAFTLLELLIVLTIIGILTAVGMAAYGRIQDSAKIKAASLEIKQFRLAIMSYHMDKNSYPQSAEELYESKYINKDLLTDPWGLPYRLDVSDNGWVVISAGPDKRFGTADDIKESENGDR